MKGRGGGVDRVREVPKPKSTTAHPMFGFPYEIGIP